MKNIKSWSPTLIIGSVCFALIATAIVLGMHGLAWPGKASFLIFLAAIWAWTLTKADATLVAVVTSFALWAISGNTERLVLSGLGDPFVVFVVSGFMLGAAYKISGLSERIALAFAQKSRNVGQLFYLMTTALLLLSFVVPSTSARAALLMPVYVAISDTHTNKNVQKALAVLFPTIIVLSCVTSYLGAGANLMTADFIAQFAGERITYLEWLLLGAPVGIISCYLSTWVILRLFLTPADRTASFVFEVTTRKEQKDQSAQHRILLVTLVLILLWVSESWHGFDAGMVALGGVLLLCMPSVGVISFKQAIKEVEWSLVVFMAATIEISHAIVKTGLAEYVMLQFTNISKEWSGEVMLFVLLLVSLLSHLLIHSRTARAAVMMPVLIPLGIAAGHSGLLIAFFINAAMGYCLTLPVCAKPVAMFSTVGEERYTSSDLMRLSAWLLPMHLILFLSLYLVYSTMSF
jgi:solute carrier family 13 (sodium-dependent dicarboxylate transporter), member 2/3/5